MTKTLTFIKKYKAPIIIGVIVLFSVVIGFLALNKTTNETVYTLKRENLVNTVLVNATYTTASQTEVYSPSKGIITKLFVSNNQQVKKGDSLFYVESTATDDERQAAYANFTAALSQLQSAQNSKQALDVAMWEKQQAYLSAQNTQNYKNAHTKNPATGNDYTEIEKFAVDRAVDQTEKDFRAAEQAYKTADISVTAAQAKVNQAKKAYDETRSTTVYASASGMVVNLRKTVGDQVAALPTATQTDTLQTSAVQAAKSPPILVISDFSNPIVTASVNEVNVPRIKTGQKAYVVFDAFPDQKFMGEVENIDDVGNKEQGTVTYYASIRAVNLSSLVKPNMTASVTIETARKNNIVTVPNNAIIKNNGKTYVQKTNNGKRLIEIKLGLRGVTKTEVISGLSEGDRVIVSE